MATDDPRPPAPETIKAMFRMAGVELSDAQMPLVEAELANMAGLVAMLNEIDVSGVEPAASFRIERWGS